MWSIAKAMKDALEATGYSELREYQRKTIEAYMSGRDVFVSAPTGGGKSLTFELAPYTFDRLFGEDCNAIVLVIVSNLNSHGIRVHRRRLLGRRARGYFKSERENSTWESRGDPQQLPTHFSSPKTKSLKIIVRDNFHTK